MDTGLLPHLSKGVHLLIAERRTAPAVRRAGEHLDRLAADAVPGAQRIGGLAGDGHVRAKARTIACHTDILEGRGKGVNG